MKSFNLAVRLFAALLATVSAAQASEAVLSSEFRDELCVSSSDGKLIVDTYRLANRVMQVAGMPFEVLDISNQKVVSNDSVDRSEIFYVIENYNLQYLDRAAKPIDPALRKRVIARLHAALIGDLQADLSQGQSPDGAYVLKNPANMEPLVSNLFRAPTSMVIECVPKDSDEEVVTAGLNAVRLRGKVEDLAKADIKEAEFAKISYQQDYQSRESTFSIDGVVGLVALEEENSFSVIPYAHYQRVQATGKDDVHAVSPGLLFHFFDVWPQRGFGLEAALNAEATFDLAQDAQTVKLSSYVRPHLTLAQGLILNGGYGNCIGAVGLWPQLDLIVEGADVLDAGTSVELASAKAYLGLGAELSLEGRFCRIPKVGALLSPLVFKATVRDLEFVAGELTIERAIRHEFSISYLVPDHEFLSLAATYANGENDETFQKEKRFEVSLGIRF